MRLLYYHAQKTLMQAVQVVDTIMVSLYKKDQTVDVTILTVMGIKPMLAGLSATVNPGLNSAR